MDGILLPLSAQTLEYLPPQLPAQDKYIQNGMMGGFDFVNRISLNTIAHLWSIEITHCILAIFSTLKRPYDPVRFLSDQQKQEWISFGNPVTALKGAVTLKRHVIKKQPVSHLVSCHNLN